MTQGQLRAQQFFARIRQRSGIGDGPRISDDDLDRKVTKLINERLQVTPGGEATGLAALRDQV